VEGGTGGWRKPEKVGGGDRKDLKAVTEIYKGARTRNIN